MVTLLLQQAGLIFLPSTLTEFIFQHIQPLAVIDRTVPVASWQVLALLKLYAGGPQDLLDAQQILKVRHPQPDDLRQITEMADSLGIPEEWTGLLSRHRQANRRSALHIPQHCHAPT